MPDTTCRKLQNRPGRSVIALRSGCVVLFGLPFLICGIVWFVAVTMVIPSELNRTDIPAWVWAIGGVIFILAGGAICGYGLREMIRSRRTRERLEAHPGHVWLADHPWDMTGVTDHALRATLTPLLLTGSVILFLLPFNYIALFVDDSFFVRSLVGLFDLGAVGLVGYAIYRLVRYAKFGSSELHFRSFPFFLGEAFEAELSTPRCLGGLRSIGMALRCVEERFETSSDDTHEVVCYQIYGDTVRLEPERDYRAADAALPVRFPLPADGRPTVLSERPPVYWELEVTGDAPGVDWKTRFLLPVYARPE